MDISNRKRSSLDNTRHENQSDEKVVNTHSEGTKLSATDLSFTSAHQFASECCTPTKQIKLSVKSERLRKSSNVSPKSDASDANSPLEHSPSSASTAHASSLPGSVSPIRIKYSPLRKDFVIFRNGRNQPLRSSHPMTTSSLSVPPSHTRKDYVNIRNRRNQPPSSSHPVSSSPLSGSSSGRNDFVSLQNRRNQPFNQSRPMTTSLPVSSSAGASSSYLPRSVQRIGLSGYSSPLGPPPRTLFSSRPYGHSPQTRTFLSSRPNEKESPKIISSDSISSSKVPSIQSFLRLPNATAPGSSVPVPSQKPTTRKPTVKQESSINNQMANAQSLSSSAMQKSSSPIKQENITGNQTPKSTETLFGVTIPAAYQYVDTRNRSSQLSTKSCGPTTPVSIKQRRNTYDQSSSRHSPTRSTSVSVKSERNSKAPTSQSLTCSSAPMIGRNSPVLFRTKLRIRNLDVCPDLSSIPRTRDDRPYWQPPNVSLRSSVPGSTSSITLLTSSSALDRQSTNNSAIRTATTSSPTVSLSPFTFASSSAFLKQEKDTKTSGSSASSFSRVSSSADRTSPVFFRSPLRNKFSSGSDPFGSEAQTRTPRKEDESNQQSHLIQRSSVPAFASSTTFPTRSSASNDQSANTTRIMTNTTLTSSYSSPILHATSPRLQPKQGKAAATKTSNSLTGSSSPRASSSGRTSPVLRLPKLNIVSSLLLDPDGAVPSRNPPKRKHPVCQHSDQPSNKTSIGRRPVSSAAVPLPPPTGQASPLPIKQEKSEFDQRISTGPSSSSASALGQDFGGRKADKSFSYFSRNSDPFRSAGPSAFRSPPKRRSVVPVTRIDDKTCVSTSTTNVSGSASTSTSNAPSQAPSCFSTNNSLPASTASDFSPNTSTERPVYHHLSNSRRSYPYLPKTGYSYWSGTRRTPTTQSQPTLSSLPNTT